MFFLDLDFFRFRFIMYLVVALLKVALVNFTLNEYMMMMMIHRHSITCHIWDHAMSPVICKLAPTQPWPGRLVVYLPTVDGQKAELTLVVGSTPINIIITSAKEVMFLPDFVCRSVCLSSVSAR